LGLILVLGLLFSGCAQDSTGEAIKKITEKSVVPTDKTPECTVLFSGMDFNQDYNRQTVNVCKNTYNLAEGINISGNGITLNCNNSNIIGNGSEKGIEIIGNNNTITKCNVENYEIGFSLSLYLMETQNNILTENTAKSNNRGFGLGDFALNNTITNNISKENYSAGFEIRGNSNTITNNISLDNLDTGGYHVYGIVIGGEENIISNNLVSNNERGVEIGGARNTVSNNKFFDNKTTGLTLVGPNNTVSNNIAKGNIGAGFYVWEDFQNASNNVLIGNYSKQNGRGISVQAENTNLIGNIVSENNQNGLTMYSESNNLDLSTNYFCYNSVKDISCTDSNQTTFFFDHFDTIGESGCNLFSSEGFETVNSCPVCSDLNSYVCGDVDLDGNVTVADLTYLVNYLFKGGEPPLLECMGNVDGITGSYPIDVADLTYFVNYLFKGGPALVCGEGTTGKSIDSDLTEKQAMDIYNNAMEKYYTSIEEPELTK